MADLQTRLDEAETAYHRLVTGTKAVSIKKDGREVTYTTATVSQLRTYIESLKRQLNIVSSRRGPAGVGL